MKKFQFFVGAISLSALAFPLVLSAQEQPPMIPVESEDAPLAARRDDEFSAVNLALREDRLNDAARELKQMRPTISEKQTARWETLAARVALRLGDAKWLKEINASGNLREAGDSLRLLAAMRFLLAARYDDAQRELEAIEKPEELSEIPVRRYMQLRARLAQLRDDKKEEMIWVRKMVDFAGRWSSSDCQSCHANPKKYGRAITTFDVKNWWMGSRYSELLTALGEAEKIREEASNKLQKNANDNSAKLRLAYALRALKRDAEADAKLREISWAQFPDREVKKPMRFGVFP